MQRVSVDCMSCSEPCAVVHEGVCLLIWCLGFGVWAQRFAIDGTRGQHIPGIYPACLHLRKCPGNAYPENTRDIPGIYALPPWVRAPMVLVWFDIFSPSLGIGRSASGTGFLHIPSFERDADTSYILRRPGVRCERRAKKGNLYIPP